MVYAKLNCSLMTMGSRSSTGVGVICECGVRIFEKKKYMKVTEGDAHFDKKNTGKVELTSFSRNDVFSPMVKKNFTHSIHLKIQAREVTP